MPERREKRMRIRPIVCVVGVVLTAALAATSGRAQSARSPLPYIAAPSNVGSSRASSDPPVVEQPPARLRSGPPSIACWAHPSNTKAYCGYYVGGGSVGCRGQPRLATEGTWGWDYHGCWLPQRVFLQWWHGRCSQGGAGAYRVDGPHPLKTLREHAEGRGPP
jgi:hypothetical protein